LDLKQGISHLEKERGRGERETEIGVRYRETRQIGEIKRQIGEIEGS
jgi:hypothetical protein